MGESPTVDRLTRGVLSRRSGDRDLDEAHANSQLWINSRGRIAGRHRTLLTFYLSTVEPAEGGEVADLRGGQFRAGGEVESFEGGCWSK